MDNQRHHHIRFKEGPAVGSPEDWIAELKKVNGVTGVKIDADKKDVFVEYDLLKCREEAIEHWMVKTGFKLDESIMQRLKRGWVHYTEENELDSLGAKPHSCCSVDENADEIEKKKK
jgi:copper chaperone CopZ